MGHDPLMPSTLNSIPVPGEFLNISFVRHGGSMLTTFFKIHKNILFHLFITRKKSSLLTTKPAFTDTNLETHI